MQAHGAAGRPVLLAAPEQAKDQEENRLMRDAASVFCHNDPMAAKISRRQLATVASASLAASSLAAAQAQPAAQSEDDLAVQRESLRRNREQLAKVKLPMDTEPAFQFKA
jgi:hypothetical protein